MKWGTVLHALSDPAWAAGGLLIARRAGEAALPFSKRIVTAFISAIPAATLAAGGALMGGYIALQDTIHDIRSEFRTEDIRIRATISERTALRQEQMTAFSKTCADAQMHIGTISARMAEIERSLARLQALEDMRHSK